MPASSDIARLGQRVAASHGWDAARAFKAYAWSEHDRTRIAECARQVVTAMPAQAIAPRLLNAALAVQLERALDAPVHLVAGELRIENIPVFGADARCDADTAFTGKTPVGTPEDEQAHLWVMIGAYVIDAAIFRLAARADCPALLARHVHTALGSDKALYADAWRHARRIGLDYLPRHVLTRGQVDTLMIEAYDAMRALKPQGRPEPHGHSA